MTALDKLLQSYRDAAVTEREKGTYLERLACAFLTADPVQAEEYVQVWSWSEWAAEHGWSGKDLGIDLVANLRNEDGFAAIQCKFYDAKHRIQKADIDSFISASGKTPFVRRVVIHTTEVPWGANAEEMIVGQSIPVVRLSLTHLRESPIDWTIFGIRGETVLSGKKKLRPHQIEAIEAVRSGLTDIPPEAYDYVVNGKPALEWVMERQVVKTDKASGIVNDANDYANETIGDPAYPLDLFRRVITVSLKTMKIVNALPKLDLPK